MFDTLMNFFLYFLIISSLFFLALHALWWLMRRQPLFKPKQMWSSIINLLSGLLGLWLLKSAMLGSSGVMLVIGILMTLGFLAFYRKEFIDSFKG